DALFHRVMCSGFVQYSQTFSTGALIVFSTVSIVLSSVAICLQFILRFYFILQTSVNYLEYMLCKDDNYGYNLRQYAGSGMEMINKMPVRSRGATAYPPLQLLSTALQLPFHQCPQMNSKFCKIF